VLYLIERGLSAGQAGMALGAYSCGAILGTFAGGELTHRVGARSAIALSMASSAFLVASVPALSAPGRVVFLIAVVAALGAATQVYRPAAATLISDLLSEEQRVMAFSMLRVAMNIGAAIGPLVAAALILVDWNLLFWYDGLTALAYAVLALTQLPHTPAGGDRPGSAAAHVAARSTYVVMVRDSRFLLYLGSMLLSALIYVQFYAVLPLKITADGHGPGLYSVVLALSSGLLIACELKVTAYVRRWLAPGIAAGIGTALFALGLSGYGLSSGSVPILLSTVVGVAGLMVSGPTMFAHPAKAPAGLKARYLAASQALFSAGMTAGATLGVLVWRDVGEGVWLLCGLIGAIAATCAVAGVNERWAHATSAAS
jgi:MFS family permease